MFEVRDTMPDTEVSWSRSEERAPMGWGSSAMKAGVTCLSHFMIRGWCRVLSLWKEGRGVDYVLDDEIANLPIQIDMCRLFGRNHVHGVHECAKHRR
jgi:hypothetical protein